MGAARQRFWEAKLAAAKAEHAAELRKMRCSGGGASLRRLERLSRAISKATRELSTTTRSARANRTSGAPS